MRPDGMANSVWVAVLTVAVLLWGAGTAGGKVIYVDDDANGSGDGASWATAYKHLQDALADANTADKPVEIRVASGVYRPDRCAVEPNGTGDRAATFALTAGVAIRGGYAGLAEDDPNARDSAFYETILSGDLAGDDSDVNDPCDLSHELTRSENSYHVVTVGPVDDTAFLEGVTVKGGHAFRRPMHPMVPTPENKGGGLYNSNSGQPHIIDCLFAANHAEESGGAVYSGSLSGERNPSLVRCRFIRNSAASKDGHEGLGGGVYSKGGHLLVSKCAFHENYARQTGGAVIAGVADSTHVEIINSEFTKNRAETGGAVRMLNGEAFLTSCSFTENHAEAGAAMANTYNSISYLKTCTFNDNRSGEGAAILNSCSEAFLEQCRVIGNRASSGGAIWNTLSTIELERCILAGNQALRGGVIQGVDKTILLAVNCTLAGNRAESGSIMESSSYEGTWPGVYRFDNCILWDGEDFIRNSDGSEISVNFSDIEGGWPGNGNIDADPCFADYGYWDANGTAEDVSDDFWVDGDYHLRSQAGRWDVITGQWMTDEATSPCIDAGDPISAIGLEPFPNGGRVNMGAYGGTAEASKSYFGGPVCETIVAGDINGDCRIDFTDFQCLSINWLRDIADIDLGPGDPGNGGNELPPR